MTAVLLVITMCAATCEQHSYPWMGSLASCQSGALMQLPQLVRPGMRVREWRCENG